MAKMIIMVLDDVEKLQEVTETWRRLGSCGVTILESSGAGRLALFGVRDDMPLFPGLRSIIEHQEVHHRTLFTIVDDNVDLEAFFDATEAIVGPLEEPNSGIIVALPVISVRGVRKVLDCE